MIAIPKGGILVYSENSEVITELMTIGLELGIQTNTKLTVVLVGEDTKDQADDVINRGAESVLSVRVEPPQPSGTEAVSCALYKAVLATEPILILLGSTSFGSELAARVAQMIRVPCASNCMDLQIDDDGNLQVDRRIYGGRYVVSQVICGTPRFVTIQPKRFQIAKKITEKPNGNVIEITVKPKAPRVRQVSISKRSRSQVDISKSEIIIAAGRGIKKLEDLEMLEKLAGLLGGVVAGTRPLTGDVDWLPIDRRIGLSGQTVKPNLYIACGISGQIEHIVGMKGARTVVAINNDPQALIHAESDYSVVGDLYEIIPALISACEKKFVG